MTRRKDNVEHTVIHSCTDYLPRACQVPGTVLGPRNTKLNRAEFLSARYSPASGTFNILGQIFQSSFYGMLMGSLLKGSENPRLKIIAVLCAKH